MMGLSKEYDPKFRKTLKRDAIVLLLVSAGTAMGIVLTLYLSWKYNS